MSGRLEPTDALERLASLAGDLTDAGLRAVLAPVETGEVTQLSSLLLRRRLRPVQG